MENEKKPHSLIIEAGKIQIAGVLAVLQSDDKLLEVKLADSSLTINGEGLSIVKLDLDDGRLQSEGKITALKYGGKGEKLPLLKRLLK